MNKNRLLIAICFAIGFLIIYYICISALNNFNFIYPSFLSVNNDEIQYYAITKTLTNSSGTFIIENNTDDTWMEGKRYLEKNINGIWYRFIPKQQEITLLAQFYIHPKSKFEIFENFEFKYGKLTKGKYRIINETIKKHDERREEKKPTAAYFEIK